MPASRVLIAGKWQRQACRESEILCCRSCALSLLEGPFKLVDAEFVFD